jgi:hypothetical protein
VILYFTRFFALAFALAAGAWLPLMHADCVDKNENVKNLRMLATDYDQGAVRYFSYKIWEL